MRALVIAIPAIAAIGLSAANVASQERQGRYVMNPVDNGFVRLDTETGAMSVCTQRNGRWVCELMEDEAKALQEEIERLKAEVKRLKDQAALAEPSPDRAYPSERPERSFELPTEEEVDKALDYFENIFRKFRERIEKFEKEQRGAEGRKDGTQL